MKNFTYLFFLLVSINGFTQDPEFTQFYANPIYLNPAMAGSNGCPRLNMNYRNQWANISGAYVTNSVSYDRFVNTMQGGVAVMVTNDMAGKNTLNWSTISLVYSYHLQITRDFTLLIGTQATWNQKFLDWSKLTFGDQIDPLRGFIYATGDLPSGPLNNSSWSTKGFFDVSSGIVGYWDKFYFGFAGKHLNKPNQSLKLGDSRLPIRYTVHAGGNFEINGKSKYISVTTISPNVIYTRQENFQQLNIGAYIKHGVFTAGTWWRTSNISDAFMMSIGLDAGTYKIGYSYDITISRLTNATGGSHELSLGINFSCKEKPKKFRTMICPSF